MKTSTWGCILFALLLGFLPLASAEPYLGSDIVVAGKDFSRISAINAVDPSGPDAYGWFTRKNSIWTNWPNEWVEYQAYLVPGLWRIGLNVMNIGTNRGDPSWYPEFQFNVEIPGQPAILLKAPASDREETYGYIDINLPEGIYPIKFSWLNDKNDPSTRRDANLQINTFFCDRIGEYTPPPPPEDDDGGGGGGGCWIKSVLNR